MLSESKRKGQSVHGTQIVYKTKSDLNVFVILQR